MLSRLFVSLVLAVVLGPALTPQQPATAQAATSGPAARLKPPGAALTPGHVLRPGKSLRSADRHYLLTVQRNGNVRLKVVGGRQLWMTDTAGHPGARLVLRNNGSLEVRSRTGKRLWMAHTHRANSALVVGNDGNLTMSDPGGVFWQTGSLNDRLMPGETLEPGWFLQDVTRTYTWIQQTDGNFVLYGPSGALWDSHTAGQPGASTIMQGDGNLVTYNGPAIWDSRTAGHPGAWAVVQSDGNLVVYGPDNAPLWDRYPDAPAEEQVDIMAPVDGVITSHPSSHHIVFGGDWAEDIGTYGGAGSPVYVRFANPTGNLSLSVSNVRQACQSGGGGLAVDVAVTIDGTLVGHVTYAHLANLQVTSGGIGNGAQLGNAATGLPYNENCWTGPHVHFEPYNQHHYSCYQNLATGTGVGGGTRIGVLGGNVASGIRTPC